MVLPYYSQSSFAIKGQCDMLRVWRFCESIANALEYLHNKGIGHNDISLPNVLIGKDGFFILSDFSNNQKSLSFDEDNWKFGCAIMELVSGKHYVSYKYHTSEMLDIDINVSSINYN